MKVGDLVRTRYNTSTLGIITEIRRSQHGDRFTEYIIFWNSGLKGYLTATYLEAVKICPRQRQ